MANPCGVRTEEAAVAGTAAAAAAAPRENGVEARTDRAGRAHIVMFQAMLLGAGVIWGLTSMTVINAVVTAALIGVALVWIFSREYPAVEASAIAVESAPAAGASASVSGIEPGSAVAYADVPVK